MWVLIQVARADRFSISKISLHYYYYYSFTFYVFEDEKKLLNDCLIMGSEADVENLEKNKQART